TSFPGTHVCTFAELQSAAGAGDLAGLTDTAGKEVTSFWAIDNSRPPLAQCQDDVSSNKNWEYGTAHTPSRGDWVALDNGTLGTLQTGQQCNFTNKSVGCCKWALRAPPRPPLQWSGTAVAATASDAAIRD